MLCPGVGARLGGAAGAIELASKVVDAAPRPRPDLPADPLLAVAATGRSGALVVLPIDRSVLLLVTATGLRRPGLVLTIGSGPAAGIAVAGGSGGIRVPSPTSVVPDTRLCLACPCRILTLRL